MDEYIAQSGLCAANQTEVVKGCTRSLVSYEGVDFKNEGTGRHHMD